MLVIPAFVLAQPFNQLDQNFNQDSGSVQNFGFRVRRTLRNNQENTIEGSGVRSMQKAGARTMRGSGECQDLELQTVSGTVSEIDRNEIKLTTADGESEIHMPSWSIQEFGIEEGDSVTATGVYPLVHGGEDMIPFELTINGEIYGSAEERMPVWRQ